MLLAEKIWQLCSGEFLCRIGKERTAECHHCDHLHDSAQHTLEACPVWAAERAELVVTVRADISLPAVIRAMVGGRGAWRAVSSYAAEGGRGEGEARRKPTPRGSLSVERWGPDASADRTTSEKAEAP